MPAKHPVAVLIPTYNPDPALLKEALDRLKNQTYEGWTALIHDDCSTVDTEAIVKPYLQDERFTFKKSPERLGIGGNWNACVKQCDAEYAAFLFQDDLWEPAYLKEALEVLEAHPTVGFVSMEHTYKMEGMADVAPLYEDVYRYRQEKISEGFHSGPAVLRRWIDMGLTPNIIGEPSFVVMRKEALDKMGPFLTDMPQFLDVEYWTRLLLGYDWFWKRGSFGAFRVHAGGASAINQKEGAGLFDRLRCFGLLIDELSGDTKKAAMQARADALRKMFGKFFRRIGKKGKVSAQGSGELKRFCLRHPLQIISAFLAYLTKGDK